jgi:hypothetical protein
MQNPMVDDALNAIKADILKAAETISTYTFSPASRSIFSPENLDEKIKYLVPTDTPVRNRLPRVKGKGQAATWKLMTSRLHTNVSGFHSGAGTNTGIWFADAGAPSETSQTYSTATAAYKLLGRKLEVGGLALAASKGRDGQPDMQTDREKIKMLELMIGEEEAIINGDVDSSNQFSGLFRQITTNSGTTTFLTASGIGNYARTLYAAGGDPTLLLANSRQLQALADDLERTGNIQRNVIADQTGVTGGFALSRLVNPVTQSVMDVKPSRFVGRSSLLLMEKSAAGENWMEMDDLIPVSRVDVPSSNFSYISFILEATVLKVIGEPYQMEITVGA